jgi:hypothetical protein
MNPKKATRPGARVPAPKPEKAPEGHEGGTDSDIGDRGGPGAGYDKEPEQQKGRGSGVA